MITIHKQQGAHPGDSDRVRVLSAILACLTVRATGRR